MSASDMRAALMRGDLKAFKTFIPEDSQKQAEYIFTRVLGGEPAQQPEEDEPLAESFRATDLFGLIEEVIEEMSSMSGGAVTGTAVSSSGKGPWPDFDEEENEKEKEKQKLTGEPMVEEIMNYLFSSEATL